MDDITIQLTISQEDIVCIRKLISEGTLDTSGILEHIATQYDLKTVQLTKED